MSDYHPLKKSVVIVWEGGCADSLAGDFIRLTISLISLR